MDERKFLFAYDRRRTSTLTLDEQPGAHTGSTRKYIPGYSDANIVYRAPTTGSDSNDGLTELTPKQTKAACDTAAGTTKKIRIIEACTLNESVSKPTEMKRGVNGSISSSLTDPVASLTASTSHGWTSGQPRRIVWVPKYKKFYGVGSTEIVSSSDGDTWALEETITGALGYRIYYSEHHQRIYVLCTAGKLLYSDDGSTFIELAVGSDVLGAIAYSKELGRYALGSLGKIYHSIDGIEWESVTLDTDNGMSAGVYADGKFVFFNSNGELFYSTNGTSWAISSPLDGFEVTALTYMESVGLFIAADAVGEIWSSANSTTWTSRRSATGGPSFDALYIAETGVCVIADNGRVLTRSTDGTTWTSTSALAAYGINDQIRGIAYSVLLGRIAAVGGNDGGTTRVNALGPAYANTISASIAGFTVQAMQYSGTVTAYNCTMRQPGTTAALTLDACRVNYDSHISNNAAKSRATLYIGDRHTTCTPATQNDIDMNLDTVGGTWYIYNASQTGYERIRDCIVEGGIVANYPVTVSGRANTRGTSENVLFGATVTHNDPKFVDTTDYALQFQTNGYDKNSPAAGRSAIYFNSSGGARDIGAWSYIESAVSYYYAKSRYLYKGQDISHGLEFNLTEQQGDSGVMNVYGNTQRIKEVLTMQYGSTQEEERAVFYEMLTLKDKGVKITFAEWEDNTGTVTVNGNQSAGAEFLTVDAVQVFNGMTVTIAGEVYSVMRASPNMTAATKLILDRPTTDAVSDNDVLTTNYPGGAGEYQFSGPTNITMKQNASTGLAGWRTGFAIRLIRKYQG